MPQRKLPIVVLPIPDEFPVAWFARLAYAQRIPTDHLIEYIGLEAAEFKALLSADPHREHAAEAWRKITKYTDINASHFPEYYGNKHIKRIWQDVYINGYQPEEYRQKTVKKTNMMRGTHICPQCCAEQGTMDKKSIERYAAVCDKHGVILVNYCPACDTRIRVYEKKRISFLACPKCGLGYSEMEAQPAREHALLYQSKMYEEERGPTSDHTQLFISTLFYRRQSDVRREMIATRRQLANFKYGRSFFPRLYLLVLLGELYVQFGQDLETLKYHLFTPNALPDGKLNSMTRHLFPEVTDEVPLWQSFIPEP